MSERGGSFNICTEKVKKLRFNEENIRSTHYPQRKSYGFMALSEAQTPYPRLSNPVEAEALRKRLQACIQKVNKRMSHQYEWADDDDERSFNFDDLQTPMNSLASESEEQRHLEFIKKRKQYNFGEFIIAQQKAMCFEIPEPGPSIGDNWRLTDQTDKPVYKVPSAISSFVESYKTKQTSINYETLQEVVKHLNIRPPNVKD